MKIRFFSTNCLGQKSECIQNIFQTETAKFEFTLSYKNFSHGFVLQMIHYFLVVEVMMRSRLTRRRGGVCPPPHQGEGVEGPGSFTYLHLPPLKRFPVPGPEHLQAPSSGGIASATEPFIPFIKVLHPTPHHGLPSMENTSYPKYTPPQCGPLADHLIECTLWDGHKVPRASFGRNLTDRYLVGWLVGCMVARGPVAPLRKGVTTPCASTPYVNIARGVCAWRCHMSHFACSPLFFVAVAQAPRGC